MKGIWSQVPVVISVRVNNNVYVKHHFLLIIFSISHSRADPHSVRARGAHRLQRLYYRRYSWVCFHHSFCRSLKDVLQQRYANFRIANCFFFRKKTLFSRIPHRAGFHRRQSDARPVWRLISDASRQIESVLASMATTKNARGLQNLLQWRGEIQPPTICSLRRKIFWLSCGVNEN